MTRRIAAVCAVAGLLSFAGCGSSPEDLRADYCEQVSAQQPALSEVMAEEGPDTLLRALPILHALADDAPRDVRDEWERLISALDGLDEALDEAGVEATTYDAEKPPAGVTDAQQRAIAAAADELVTRETVDAWEGVKQHAKDVCKTPLYQ